MSKKGKLRVYAERKGDGGQCNKCSNIMERRKRIKIPENKHYYFSEWDYCVTCANVKHYEKYKVYLDDD